MNSRIILASLIIFFHATYGMQSSDLTLINFSPLITRDQIAERVVSLGRKIDAIYCKDSQTPLVILTVMKGAMIFAADLIRAIQMPNTELQFIQASSYGHNGTQAGQLTIRGVDQLTIENKHVLIVDDIFDTGVTISKIKAQILEKNPASIKSLVLLRKLGKSKVKETPDFFGFEIPDKFVIGYGLDYKECYRGLPSIWAKD
ncbi:MAG: hypoxanthine phosphoribosyltransferase [Candidatus Babeliales bacterium]